MNPANQSETYDAVTDSPYLLYCHNCKDRLIIQSNMMGIRYYECPNTHAEVQWYGKEIIGYTVFWDADDNADERYKLCGQNNTTTLYKKVMIDLNNKHWGGKVVAWKTILNMEHLFKLEIKNNILVVNNLLKRLQNLKAFT